MKNTTIITIVLVLLVGSASFFAGMKYQQSKSPRFANFQGNRNGQFQQRATGGGARPVRGEILSQDDESITVKLADGSSKIVILSTTTSINKAAEGSKDDLKVGEQVYLFGSENSDGSITAQNIQINPMQNAGGQPGDVRPPAQ